jgi:transposase
VAVAWRACADWQAHPRLWTPADQEFINWMRHFNRSARPADSSPAFLEIEQWRRYDNELWQTVCHTRDKAQAARRDFYRKAAVRICNNAAILIFNEFNIARAARLTEDNPLFAAARRNRTIAAVSSLRLEFRNFAAKNGIAIETPREGATFLCSYCWRRLKPSDPARLPQQCRCGRVFDQDEEACRAALGLHGAIGPMVAK